MSFFKSLAANSSVFTPREATMAMTQSSPYRVLLQRTGSSLRKTPSGQKEEEGRYKHTVDLPKTTFGMRANALVREPEIQKLWDDHQVFKRVVNKNDRVVLQSLDQDTRKDLTPLKLRAKAAKFAKATVKAQMSSFQRYGVWADWSNPYLTLDPEYEAAQIEVFGEMALKGYIYRGRKPVHWSPSSRTALAEAELEAQSKHPGVPEFYLLIRGTLPSAPTDLNKVTYTVK
ncbi:hypothetical protein COLO4_04960 [Corchorus olitorius]|uniref:Aminoacyl-tRNA synthetase class Ia domain-containing protein n=1 Tax=Corchorus olitorius TaxID=93759 RepID=A0A1R3KSD3_9ROSI|nr:hypothetical protein COLO4_04960 [Corchorus olitorius]